MDIVPSIWMSSVTSALLFFCGGSLWGKAASLRRTREDAAPETRRPAETPVRPSSGHRLEEIIEERLDDLRRHVGPCRAAVIADPQGLLVASSGDHGQALAVAAAASMAADTAARVRQFLPLGEPVEIRLVFAGEAVVTARWIDGDHERLLLATVSEGKAEADPGAEAIRASLSNLFRWT